MLTGESLRQAGTVMNCRPSIADGQFLFPQFFADINTKGALTEEQFTKAD